MNIIYQHIYRSLRAQDFEEVEIQQMMRDSGLDIDKNVLEVIEQEIRTATTAAEPPRLT